MSETSLSPTHNVAKLLSVGSGRCRYYQLELDAPWNDERDSTAASSLSLNYVLSTSRHQPLEP